jgi:alpha-L-rhamnosidase
VEPHFTYHGFRYVELTGVVKKPNQDAVVGRVFHSAAPPVGQFSCSSELLNKIMHCVDWVQRANMMSVPTDCPQRTEREGWMGDIQAFSQTAMFQRDMAGFFTKWVPDIRDSQADDGRYPDVAPHISNPNVIFSGVPAWGDAGTVVPWRMYQNYADTRMLEQHFDSARRWVDFIHSHNPDLLWRNQRANDYNDWLNGDTLILQGYPRGISAVPNELFATAFFAHSTEIVAKMAAVLGRKAEAAAYSRLFEGVKVAFNKAYVAADGHIRGDTQAGYALALHFNLLDAAIRPKATEHLLRAIAKYRDHPSTGIQTTHRMLLELSRNGHHEDAWRLVNLRTVPSWGYMVEMGATTIWERWDGYVKGRGFQDPGMNSFNHWAFGSVGEWVWRELVGINPDDQQPGYKHFLIHPRPCGDLAWAKARYDGIRGPIVSEWRIAGGQILLHVEVPANTTATVIVPTSSPAAVSEGGKARGVGAGVTPLGPMAEGGAAFAIASGRYDFVAPK